MASQTTSAPFTQAVIKAMRQLYPEDLADKSWDNTGLLLEAPFDPKRRQKNSALLTIDLTKAVADEAIKRKDSIVVAYHPIIFRGLKSFTLADTQQQSLLKLAAAGISVYCPHTALDAAAGGLGDWLADLVTGAAEPLNVEDRKDGPGRSGDARQAEQTAYDLHRHPRYVGVASSKNENTKIEHTRSPIKGTNASDDSEAGMGRIVRFKKPQKLSNIVQSLAVALGNPRAFPMAIPQDSSLEDITVRAIAICAGSGGSLFANLPSDVDLLFTGELSHHEALAQVEKGRSIISLFHSNSERGFLHAKLRPQLEDAVRKEWGQVRQHESNSSPEMEEAVQDGTVTVDVSERDQDPFGIAIAR